jgi:hypothetical protein
MMEWLFGGKDSSGDRETKDTTDTTAPNDMQFSSSGGSSDDNRRSDFDPVAALMAPPPNRYCQPTLSTTASEQSSRISHAPSPSTPNTSHPPTTISEISSTTTIPANIRIQPNAAIESISFACGGWLFIYMFGVAKAMQESAILAEHTDLKKVKYLGCSAGGLCAAGMTLDGDFEKAKQFCKEQCVTRAYASLGGIFGIGTYVTECLDVAVDLHKASTVPRGNLQIQFTKLPFFEGELAQEYESAEDVRKCLLSSAAAFPFAPLVHHRGQWNVDGGFSAFQPILNENTITVSPLYFMNTDIKPSRYVPLWWALFPPNSPKTVDWLFDLGYNDGVNWIHDRNEKQQNNSGKPKAKMRTRSDEYHPFDVPRQISVHRFLGFDVADLTHSSVSVIMDFFLYLLLLLVWKPTAITLIYLELFVKVIMLVTASVLYELFDLLPMLFVGYAFLAPHVALFCWMLLFTGIVKLLLVGPASGSHLGDLWEVVRCIGSASLLKRYIPIPLRKLTTDPLRKHVHLNKKSLVYRVVRHFV